jgi:RES domain-containing protein
MTFAGRVWRHVPAGAEPLHLGALFRYSEGRWNRRGEFAALYTALSREGALAEYRKARKVSGTALDPRELVSIDVEVDPVLDLRSIDAYRSLAERAGEAEHPAFLTETTPHAYEHCRRLAEVARADGYTALVVPSAAAAGEANLVVFVDVVAPKSVRLANGPDREVISA